MELKTTARVICSIYFIDLVEDIMKTILAALGLAAVMGFVSCQQAAAQYAEHNGRHHTTKCYREFVIGHYVCHTYRNW
jgi:hypothetical protein